jgi:hypothetical protein
MQLLAASTAALTITVWPQGPGGPSATHVVRCPGSPECASLARVKDPFAPVPKGTACTLIYGGPQVARVTGTYQGRRVWVRFRRSDGCEIARWNRVAFLFPRA